MIVNFSLPLNVLWLDRLYLSGYSYFKIQDSAPVCPPLFVAREEAQLLPELKWAIARRDMDKLTIIIDQYPDLPRLLTNTRGRTDVEAHDVLFAMLLFLGRTRDLERLYGVLVTDEAPALDPHSTISQRESFGSRFVLVHDGIPVSRSHECQVRGLLVNLLLGKGSFGYVFEGADRVISKYNTITAEYVREFLSACVLAMTSDTTLPPEVESCCYISPDMVQNHTIQLYPLMPITRETVLMYAEELTADWQEANKTSLCPADSLGFMVRTLMNGVRALRDRFIIHGDVSINNIMWDTTTRHLRLIDYGGTIGDDSFFDIGVMIERTCTRATRAPEYGSADTLWQRNENSEALSAYYAVMSHIFPIELINTQPHSKEEACADQIRLGITDAGNPQLQGVRRIHQAAFSLPKDRPLLDWILSDGSAAADNHALHMGCIGSEVRKSHVRACLDRFVSRWPLGRSAELSPEWKIRRTLFIKLLLSRVDSSNCGGLITRVIPPPYTTARCISLYDTLRDIILDAEASAAVEEALVRYMTENACYPVLVNAILYVALAPSKATLIDVEHYYGHPLHVLLRAILTYRDRLTSLFLSPITAWSLTLLENSCGGVNDAKIPTHRIIRCLYNLRRDRRCRPMLGASLVKVAGFVRNYMTALLREPMVIVPESSWWEKLFSLAEPQTPSSELQPHVENIIRMWFT